MLVNDSDKCIMVTVQHHFLNELKQLSATYYLVINCPNSTAELNSSSVTNTSITYVCSNNITTNGSMVSETVGDCSNYNVSVIVSINR